MAGEPVRCALTLSGNQFQMTWPTPEFSKSQINKAGRILVDPPSPEDLAWAREVLSNWRACHGYPINTFQATLRDKLKRLGLTDAFVAQRLKRMPSIIAKLKRFKDMNLARMQDIGGIRAVVPTVQAVRQIVAQYKESTFRHELVSEKDYISEPKEDGYRSVHFVFRYKNELHRQYDGLLIELQIRTRLQHAWATAVETVDTFLGKRLKADQGDQDWLHFFAVTSAAFAHLEETQPVPGYQHLLRWETFRQVAAVEEDLGALAQLKVFSEAVRDMPQQGRGSYHLVILNSKEKTVSIRPYAQRSLAQAMVDYAQTETRASEGEPIEVVLVSAGPIAQLRRAYPNYFLDTKEFVARVQGIIGSES